MKLLVTLLLSCFVTATIFAQTKTTTTAKKAPAKTTAKTKKKSSKSNKLKTTGEMEFEEVVCYEDGPCTFTIVKRDTLVYEVNTAGKQYTLYVIPNKFDAATIADFNWKLVGAEGRSGHVVVNTKALNGGKRYMVDLPSGELKLNDASSLWLSSANFKEIAKGETTVTLDNNQPETFKSPEADAVTVPINYKGKPLTLEGFSMQTKPEGEADRKEIWAMNISSNMLMIKVDNGNYTMQLKEVRERK